MTFNIRTDVRKSWLPQPGSGQVIEINQSRETERFPGISEETRGSPAGDHPLYPTALRQMLEANDYQVALVSRNQWDSLRGSRTPASSPAILLAVSWKELVDQVSELVRDSDPPGERKFAHFADYHVDFTRMRVSRASGETIVLTKQEFKTLKCFLLNPERALSRDELLNEAWGYHNYPSTRTVDNHVLRLRRKLERDPARPVHFRTIHGVGYQFLP